MKKLLVATGNEGKVIELSEMLDIPLEFANVEIDEVQSMDLEYVARRKVEEAFRLLKKPVIVDDVGVYIEAWNGFPGPFAKYVLLQLGNKNILKLLDNEKNRKVIVKSAVGYHDGKKVHVFVGEINGKIASEERGTEGWGFDPIIIPQGEKETYAEMGTKKKNTLSHRRKAFEKLKAFLDSKRKSKGL